jgi:uncharacterized protein (TIGR02646 family)
MISVYKDYAQVPSILTNEHRVQKLVAVITKEDGNLYVNNDYAPIVVKTALEKIYKNKCAYCESKIKHAASLQVEHYRPKAKVTEDEEHGGYYWLGLEWSNLLLSCPRCNQNGGKGNSFPIQGKRASLPKAIISGNETDRKDLFANYIPLISERPLLLNPEINNPKIHFYFDENGKIYGKTLEGKATINICDLNRAHLVGHRQELRLLLLKDIEIVIEANRRGKLAKGGFEYFMRKAFEKVDAQQHSDKEYSLWGWYLFHYFEKCFLSTINNKQEKVIVLAAYKSYRKGKL